MFVCAGGVHVFAWWCFFVRTSIEDLSTIDRKSMKSVKSVKENIEKHKFGRRKDNIVEEKQVLHK